MSLHLKSKMAEDLSTSKLSNRQRAAQLLDAMLDDFLTPRQVINRWPCPSGEDLSLDVTYQALMHFESDEAQQQTEVFYIDAQLALLTQMVSYLAHNEPLPRYMCSAYEQEASLLKTGYYQDSTVFHSPFQGVVQWVKNGIRIAHEALKLIF